MWSNWKMNKWKSMRNNSENKTKAINWKSSFEWENIEMMKAESLNVTFERVIKYFINEIK